MIAAIGYPRVTHFPIFIFCQSAFDRRTRRALATFYWPLAHMHTFTAQSSLHVSFLSGTRM